MQKNCKKVAKKLQKNCKKIAKKLQKSCKKIAKKLQDNCKIIAKILQNALKKFFFCVKFLQIWNLHTDFRPREESVIDFHRIY